jgi:uncharacterized protein (DUF302 family)
MSAIVRDFSISVRTAAGYPETVSVLREALKRHGFEMLCELSMDRELQRKAGLPWDRMGLRWQHYAMFVVWSPSDAYQALLSDRDGGLLVSFNLCVAGDGTSTFVAATNHYGAGNAKVGTIGVQILIRELARKIRELLMEIGTPEQRPGYGEAPANDPRLVSRR